MVPCVHAKNVQKLGDKHEVNDTRKINCWEFVKCGRELGGEKVAERGMCLAATDVSFDGLNDGKNGGRICWAVVGTFCGKKIEGLFAKKLLSCRSCTFFKIVKKETGVERFRLTKLPSQEQRY